MTAPAIAPGELTVTMVADATGRSRPAVLRQRYPQRVTAALHSDPDHPYAAVLCVQSPSGGTFSDDDLQTTVQTSTGSHLVLTTQAATQVFAGAGSGARHRLRFTVQRGSTLEYLPKTLIPQEDSLLTQSLELDIEPGGSYLGWDAVAAGRIAYGERFRYAGVDNSFTVRCDGRVIARDRQRFGRGGNPLLDGDYVATLLVLTPGRPVPAMLAAIRAVLPALPDVQVGASELPGGCGVFARLIAADAPAVAHAQTTLRTAAGPFVASNPAQITRSA